MILSDFILPTRINQHWLTSGIDSLEYCLDHKLFNAYPYHIVYQYNSRGFRDCEWPEDLQTAIWCIGDSFTVGIGSPLEHTWVKILEQQIKNRCINISMDGASNNWIARKATKILQTIKPKKIVIHWSYVHRREQTITELLTTRWKTFYSQVRDSSWPESASFESLPDRIKRELVILHGWSENISDEMRIAHHLDTTVEQDIENTIDCIRIVSSINSDTTILHSFIPDFINQEHRTQFYQQLEQLNVNYIKDFDRLDYARDGHHYDKKTSEFFVKQIKLALEHCAT